MPILVAVLFIPLYFWLGADDAHALRPFISATDAGIVAAGEVEVEAGLGFQRNTRGSDSTTVFNLPGVALNIGLARNVELDIGGGFELVRERTTEGGRRTLGSAQETSVTAKIRVHEGKADGPSLATELALLLPTQRRESLPGRRRTVGGTALLIGTAATGPLKYHINLGGGAAKDSRRGSDTVGLMLWAVAGEMAIANGLWLVSELRGQAGQRALPDNTALVGLVWASPWGVKLDIAGFAGLSRGADQGGLTFGLTVPFQVTP